MKADHALLPVTPPEIAECAEEIYEAGASIIHLHVRDKSGAHSLDTVRYAATIEAIHKRLNDKLIIQITTEAVGLYNRDAQKAVVQALKPEAFSVALREICADETDVADTALFFDWVRQETIFPQIILYDQHDVARFLDLRCRGVFAADAPFVLCVIERHGPDENIDNTLQNYSNTLSTVNVPWAVCGFGDAEHQLPAKAASLGGHARVGFENNIWRQDGSLATNNAELIRAAKASVRQSGRTLAKADDVRQMFALAVEG